MAPSAPSKPRLGEYLVSQGMLTPDQREEGVQSQVVYGGRLGTNLVELGFLTVDELAQQLEEVTGVPAPPVEWLEHPDPDALKAVPTPLVERHKVLPLRVENRTLHVAMLDPLDSEKLDDISFATSMTVKPYVLPELRLLYALELHLGLDRDLRYVDLVDREPKPDPTGESSGDDLEAKAVDTGPRIAEQTIDLGGPEDRDAPDDFDEREHTAELPPDIVAAAAPEAEASPGRSTEPRSTQVPTPGEVAALELGLAHPSDRDSIASDAIQIALAHAEAAVLFLAHPDMFVTSAARGEDLEDRLQGMVVPEHEAGMLARSADSGDPWRGSPKADGSDSEIFERLGREHVREAAIFPVKIKDRVVNLLYVDNGTEPIGRTSLAALETLCTLIAQAYESLILEKKRQG